MSAGEQLVQEDAGLKRVEETGRDQAPPQQVGFGADEGVGGGQDGAGAGPRRQHHRHPGGESFQLAHHAARNVSDAEASDDQPVEPVAEAVQEDSGVAEDQDDQTDLD